MPLRMMCMCAHSQLGTFTTCSKKLLFEICFLFALPVLVNPLGFYLADFCQKVPWERSRVAFSEVIFDENIGRTDKLSRPC